jgi:thiamine-phosphate pyrophosphorylase
MEDGNMMTSDKLRAMLALYLVTDERTDCDALLHIIRKALEGGVTTVQLRRKHDDGRQLVELGKAIRQMTTEFGALYIVNDRVDIAMLTDADGVHVGQSDIACADVRGLIGKRIIGVSTCTLAEATAADREGADYLGVGSVFPTSSKPDADMCEIQGLAGIAKQVDIPVVGIGGITRQNAPEVMQAGAAGIAVVSAIMQAEDPSRASAELLRLVRTGR